MELAGLIGKIVTTIGCTWIAAFYFAKWTKTKKREDAFIWYSATLWLLILLLGK